MIFSSLNHIEYGHHQWPFAQLVGINHHVQSCMFGNLCVFLEQCKMFLQNLSGNKIEHLLQSIFNSSRDDRDQCVDACQQSMNGWKLKFLQPSIINGSNHLRGQHAQILCRCLHCQIQHEKHHAYYSCKKFKYNVLCHHATKVLNWKKILRSYPQCIWSDNG